MASFAGGGAGYTPHPEPARELYAIFQRFCAFGKGHQVSAVELTMDSRTFLKFCKDASLVSRNLSKTSVDLIFTKTKERGQRTIDFDHFLTALTHCAVAKGVSFDALVNYVLKSKVGPKTNQITAPENVRFHDDVSSYTGVYAAGGPSSLGSGGGAGPNITLANLADRSASDVRGRKIQAAPKQRPVPVSYRPESAASAPNAAPAPAYANRTAPRRAAPQYRAAPAAAQQRPATAGRGAGGGSVFDRLTDSRTYTGAHKHRFDSSGRGRGLEGRDRITKGRGYVGSGVQYGGPKSGSAQYVGNTNTGTNQVFHDSSQFLMRR